MGITPVLGWGAENTPFHPKPNGGGDFKEVTQTTFNTATGIWGISTWYLIHSSFLPAGQQREEQDWTHNLIWFDLTWFPLWLSANCFQFGTIAKCELMQAERIYLVWLTLGKVFSITSNHIFLLQTHDLSSLLSHCSHLGLFPLNSQAQHKWGYNCVKRSCGTSYTYVDFSVECTDIGSLYNNIQVYVLVNRPPDGASGKEPACQCRRQKTLGFDPWVWKIP